MQEFINYITNHWTILMTISGVIGSVIYLVLDARYARKTAIKQSVDLLHIKFDEVEDRVDKVEQELKHLPSATDVAALQVAIKDMKSETTALRATIKGLSRLVDLLVEKEVKKEDK